MKNFVQVVISDYTEITKLGNKYIVHILPEYNKDGSVSCVETITEEYPDIASIKEEYNLFLQEQNKRILDRYKNIKLKEVDKYDISSNVNGFLLNGVQVWLDKDTRVGLMNSITIEKNSGRIESVLWLNGMCITVNCGAAIQMLSSLELYALACYNKTAEHKLAISQLTDISKVKAYDYTAGYPDKLSFKI